MSDAAAGMPQVQDTCEESGAGASPVAEGERIATLDFIRGLAVMGILAANIAAFGQPFHAAIYPGAFKGDPGDPGGWLWIAQFVLVDGKMRGLFTLLFGAGMVLFVEKARARGATRALQAWRLVILMAFGLAHFFFVWRGDILFFYALFGLVALACMGWSVRAQVAAGFIGYLAGALLYGLLLSSMWAVSDSSLGESNPDFAARRAGMAEMVEQVLARDAAENAALASGDYGALVSERLTERWTEPLQGALSLGFETLPMMLFGMALLRIGFFSGGVARATLLRWGWIGLVTGGLAHLAIGLVIREGGFSYYGTLTAFIGWSPLPRLAMVLGMAALLVVYAPLATGWLGDRVRAAGRAAFTNYLGTSIVMMLVFQGWALGLFGQLNRPQLYLVMVLAWAAMLAWSKPWLDRYRYGPLEWLWRCLTYRQLFPLRK
ncbi:MAG: DUF418 domain-containing protein [Porphyrobacter sp.]|nr:DUF418 domain-containing protein [Porphyrobacter sp.]